MKPCATCDGHGRVIPYPAAAESASGIWGSEKVHRLLRAPPRRCPACNAAQRDLFRTPGDARCPP